jgi:hypothetical protein
MGEKRIVCSVSTSKSRPIFVLTIRNSIQSKSKHKRNQTNQTNQSKSISTMMKFFYALLVALVLAATNGVSANMLESVSGIFCFGRKIGSLLCFAGFIFFVSFAFCLWSAHRKACCRCRLLTCLSNE